MRTNQNIKVLIAGRPYSLEVSKDEEELVRKAAGVLNETIQEYSANYEYKDQQDLFAMISLQHVANSLRLEEEKSFKDEELKQKLSDIDVVLTQHLEN